MLQLKYAELSTNLEQKYKLYKIQFYPVSHLKTFLSNTRKSLEVLTARKPQFETITLDLRLENPFRAIWRQEWLGTVSAGLELSRNILCVLNSGANG